MPNDRAYEGVLSSPTEESPPSYSTAWGHDVYEKKADKRWDWKSRSAWVFAYETAPETFQVFWCQASPVLKKFKPSLKQMMALSLVVSFGVLPFAMLGLFVPGQSIFYGIFNDKIQTCGDSFGTPENATVTGIEKLFVLDTTFGRFSFSQAKTIDVVWDVFIGRGVQLVAWWIGYIVFSDALLRAIERHPASFEIFQRIALEGPSLLSLWTLAKEQWGARSKRTRALFFYIWLSTLYIISIPMFLSAMTGYDSTSIAWVSLDRNNRNNIVAASMVKMSWVARNAGNETFNMGVCLDYELFRDASDAISVRRNYCDCQMRNGTIVKARDWTRYGWGRYGTYARDCILDFPGNNQSFEATGYPYGGGEKQVQKCASSFNITINGKDFDAMKVNGTIDYCYNNEIFDFNFLEERTRCLPDTSNPTYQWGFSTMLSGLFVFLHFGWSITMYIVWQDAQFMSTLVKAGYQMTPLRAAFAMAKAAKWRTGLSEKQLVRANMKELEQELYGTRMTEKANVEYEIFGAADEEHCEVEGVLRRRVVRPKNNAEPEETSERSGLSSESTAPPP